MESEHFGKAKSRKDLYIEDFLDGTLEIDGGDDAGSAKVDDGQAAFELASALGEGDAVHGGLFADFGEADEGIGADHRQAAGEACQLGDALAFAAGGIDA